MNRQSLLAVMVSKRSSVSIPRTRVRSATGDRSMYRGIYLWATIRGADGRTTATGDYPTQCVLTGRALRYYGVA